MSADGDHHPSGEDVEIRPAGPDDVVALAALASGLPVDGEAARRLAERTTFLSTQTRSPGYYRRALEQGVVLVALGGGRLVGFAQFGAVSVPVVGAGSADRALIRLHVHGSLNGRGIGRRLMRAALDGPELAEVSRFFLRVSEHNERALALYTHLGFERAGPGDFTTGMTPGGDLVLVLERQLS